MSVPRFPIKIVHFYVDEALKRDYCQKTFEIVKALKGKYQIESVCHQKEPYAYWEALKEVWGQSNLVIIEQDTVFTEAQLLELLKCKKRNCTFAYKLYPATTRLEYPVWSVGENLLPYRVRLFTLDEKPLFCNFSGMGFIKLSKETQSKIELDTPIHWKFLDLGVIGKIPDLNLHVHYEVEHGHGKERGDED